VRVLVCAAAAAAAAARADVLVCRLHPSLLLPPLRPTHPFATRPAATPTGWADEEEEEEEAPQHLTPQQRVSLECGVLRHEAAFTLQDEPIRHMRVASSAHHHQTADALTFLPRPTASSSAAAGAAAAAGASQEEVLVSCSGVMCVFRLEKGQVCVRWRQQLLGWLAEDNARAAWC
jgi:hypothetical protein